MITSRQSGTDEAIQGWSGEGWLAQGYLHYARSFPPHPTKIRLFRCLGAALFPHGLPLRGFGNVRLAVDPLDYIGHEVCFSRAYEPLSISLARRLMSAGGTFLDVGANFGLYTCSVAQMPGVECIAVDASAVAFSKLLDNLARNPDAAVRAINVALASEHTLVRLETPVHGNLGTTRVTGPTALPREQVNYVAAMPLDELLRALSVSRVRLMKIDVEGFELEVFRGMDLTSASRPEHIIMEYSKTLVSDWHDLRGCQELLTRHGYAPYTVTGEEFDPAQSLPEENLWWRSA